MKKSTPLVYSKPLNPRPEENKENPEIVDKEPKVTERIVDRLDLQLLVAVIVFFVSAWAFLNSRICGFTESEPVNVQMSYILVHYILTLVLFLCVYITAIKGNYVLRRKEEDISENNLIGVRLFIEGWFPALILCMGILVTSSFIPWYCWAIIALGLLFYKTTKLSIRIPARISLILILIILFPIFISTMTIVVKDIKVKTDKEYYSLSDDIVISVETKGYACNHALVCLGEKELYPNTQYQFLKNKIILPAYCVKNNQISVGTISPASGFVNFFEYPFKKMLGKPFIPLDAKGRRSNRYVYYKSRNLNIK
jgi:hypothetical protein